MESEELSLICKRFRVLIIGRRNAGKTTILEKMTGSDSEVGAKPEIRDKEGRLISGKGFPHTSNIDSRPYTCQGKVGGPSSQ